MAKNIEINVFNGSGYEALYPKTLWNNIDEIPSTVMKKATGTYNGTGVITLNTTIATCNIGFRPHLFFCGNNLSGDDTNIMDTDFSLTSLPSGNNNIYNTNGIRCSCFENITSLRTDNAYIGSRMGVCAVFNVYFTDTNVYFDCDLLINNNNNANDTWISGAMLNRKNYLYRWYAYRFAI